MKWTDLNYAYEFDYGAGLFYGRSLQSSTSKQLKIVAPPALAPISAGSVVAVSNDYDRLEHLQHCPSACEVSKQYDKISGSAGFFTC